MSGGNLKHFLFPLSAIKDEGFSKGIKTLIAPASALLDKKSSAAASSGSPIDSAPIPTPATPISAASQAVMLAEHDYAAQNLLKKSIAKTIIAGDTGGYSKGNSSAGAASSGYKAKLG